MTHVLGFHLLCSLFCLLRTPVKVCVTVTPGTYLDLMPKHQESESFRKSIVTSLIWMGMSERKES